MPYVSRDSKPSHVYGTRQGPYCETTFYTIDVMLDLAQNSPPNVKIPTNGEQEIGPLLLIITHPCSILQVPTTQLAKMSIDLNFVELTADVLEIFYKICTRYTRMYLFLTI